jgi:hypothetical protein
MGLVEEKLVLVFFAFMVVILTFLIRKARVRTTINLLDRSGGAR